MHRLAIFCVFKFIFTDCYQMMEEEVEESDSDDEIQKNLARKRNPELNSASPDVWKDTSGVLNLSYPGPCLPHPQVS